MLDLSQLTWTLTGWRPHAWRFAEDAPGGFLPPEVGPVPARLPGSVQQALRTAGLLADWNVGLNSRAAEWVEHRHWRFSTEIPAAALPAGEPVCFQADTLDPAGWILIDGRIAGAFKGAHQPVRLDLSPALASAGPHRLDLVFDQPPEEEAQLGHTSRARAFKPRFCYGWDWGVRLVPIGARGRLELIVAGALAVTLRRVRTGLSPELDHGTVVMEWEFDPHCTRATHAELEVKLQHGAARPVERRYVLTPGAHTLELDVPAPALWCPAGAEAPVVYDLRVRATLDGRVSAEWTRQVGFKHVAWRANPGAPTGAEPWLCVVNHRPVFLQGVNWTPVRLDYLGVSAAEVETRVAAYAAMGCNVLRVWGGAGLESEQFYAACDRAGLLVWQEFPLSSSGVDSTPPDDPAFLAELTAVARHFVAARQHHASLLLWCGGNELHRSADGTPAGARVPLDASHPALAALAGVVAADDPDRRFLPTSPAGPRFHSTRPEFGRGVHHAVHGPWGIDGYADAAAWAAYWRDDDALFRSEVGVAGASDLALIRRYAGGESTWPPTSDYWRHAAAWWTQWSRLEPCLGHATDADALARYVAHTQQEQAEYLAAAARLTKARFPACGGFLVWMGHDAFPCPSNTSLFDFDGQPKPAARALATVFRTRAEPGP